MTPLAPSALSTHLRERWNVIPAASVQPQLWPDGLGLTRVLARHLGWRLSVTEIDGRIAFPAVREIDRLLMVGGTQPLALQIEGGMVHLLPGQAVSFAGEDRVIAIAEHAEVVYVSTQRSLARARLSISTHDGPFQVPAGEDGFSMLLAGDAQLGAHTLHAPTAFLPSAQPRQLQSRSAVIATVQIAPRPPVFGERERDGLF
ncbi:MAG TPA: HutD family protein [Microbacterium sp.]|nr:HutD family protein [Microbacterium sp.]